jgi:hypothetical protein
MTLAEGGTGAVDGTVDYPGLGCGGSLSIVSISDTKLVLQERIQRGLDACVAVMRIELRPLDGEKIRYEAFYPSGGVGAWATLTRTTAPPIARLRWPSVEQARAFIDLQKPAIFSMPVLEEDWRARTTLVLAFSSRDYSRAYAEALNFRTLAHEALVTADGLLASGELRLANTHLEMHQYYFQMAVARFQEAGRVFGLAGETLKGLGQAATEVFCQSSMLAVAVSGHAELRHYATLLCIGVHYVVDLRVGEAIDGAVRDAVARALSHALWEAVPLQGIYSDWQGWVGHTARQGGSDLYRRIAEQISDPAVQEQIMRLAARAPELLASEAAEWLTKDHVRGFLDAYVTYLRAQAGSMAEAQRRPDEGAATDGACALKSVNDAERATLYFRNSSDRIVVINWLDYEGAEKTYTELRPGRTWGVSTYMTHPWCVRDKVTGRALLSYIVTDPGPKTVVIR